MAEPKIGSYVEALSFPGESIEELLNSNGMTQRELAARIGFSTKHINEVIQGKRDISPLLASKLANVFQPSAQFWNNLQSIYNAEKQRIEDEEGITEEEKDIAKRLPYNKLVSWNYLEECNSIVDRVIKLRKFMGLSDIRNAPAFMKNISIASANSSLAFRKSESLKIDDYVMTIWLKMCTLSFNQNMPEFDKSKLRESLPLIKSQISGSDINTSVNTIKEILSNCGVSFSIIHNLAGAPVQGFIKFQNNKAVLCLTLRQKFDDILWFTLFHEIGHLLLARQCKETIVDFSSDSGLALSNEDEADKFAQDILIDKKRFEVFSARRFISEAEVIEFAKEEKVPPSVVVGRLGHSSPNYFSRMANLRQRINWD